MTAVPQLSPLAQQYLYKTTSVTPKFTCRGCTNKEQGKNYCNCFSRPINPNYNRCFYHSNYESRVQTYQTPRNLEEIVKRNELNNRG
jgi:hypothetical protein